MADNTPPEEGNNNPPQPPETPPVETHGIPPEVAPVETPQPEEPQAPADPEYQKWADDTKDLPTAYKRYTDSSSEANRLREEKEKTDTELEKATQKYQAVEDDFEQLRQNNPELYGQVKEAVQALQGTVDNTQTPQAPSQPNDTPLTEEQVAQTAKLEVELGSFRKDYGKVISSDEEFDSIRKYAGSLSGKPDRDGKPFTLRTALVAALQYYKPEVLTDKAKMEAIAQVEQRNSASEPANVPGGSPTDSPTKDLNKNESEAAAFFGMTPEEYRKNQVD